ncbi:hypothetical protein TNIN_162891 [Trichonephila inaurata madagascariensis]|uniref:Uncharacterized protein n=1 Tax=Trichonephila inaurata madagascariensis TaxID=2747483 RepID=A0A8X6XWQ1_9ARAC|nr:hypothetical protein TNIN_162891 [Trichonephila inaurata madagascariensis]
MDTGSLTNYDPPCCKRQKMAGRIEAHDVLLSTYLQLISVPDDEKNQDMKEVLRKAIDESSQSKDAMVSELQPSHVLFLTATTADPAILPLRW